MCGERSENSGDEACELQELKLQRCNLGGLSSTGLNLVNEFIIKFTEPSISILVKITRP